MNSSLPGPLENKFPGCNRRDGPAYRGLHDAVAMGLFLLAALSGTTGFAHETTLHRHEQQLDRNETAVLERTTSLVEATAPVPESGSKARLTLRLVDAESGESVPGLVRVRDGSGRVVPLPGLVNRGTKLRATHPGKEWYVLTGATEVEVPAGHWRIEAFSGLETELSVTTVDLRPGTRAERVMPLRRFHAPVQAGWYGGNTHLHLRGLSRAQSDEYLRTVPLGDGLDLVFVSYLTRPGNDDEYISNSYTQSDLDALSTPMLRFGNGEEHRHNFGTHSPGYGHVLFLDLPEWVEPVSIGPGITGDGPDYPPLRRGIDQARSLGAAIVWCHNAFGFEHTPNWISGRVDAHNIFDGATVGSYAHTYYQLLNLGIRVPFSAGTDWFIYDFSRVYVRVEESLTVSAWLEGLADGRTFITNGPFLELRANGREIGDTIHLDPSESVEIQARAIGRSQFANLEIVHNGKQVASAPSRALDGHFVAEIASSLTLEDSGWIAARISGGATDTDGEMALPADLNYRPGGGAGRNEFGEALFAHTSAIYLEVAGRPQFDRAAAEGLIRRMEESLLTIEKEARFDNESQRMEVIGIYHDAIEQLRHRLVTSP
jgi:hypothetical protein